MVHNFKISDTPEKCKDKVKKLINILNIDILIFSLASIPKINNTIVGSGRLQMVQNSEIN